MTLLPYTASCYRPATIWYEREDGTLLYKQMFNPCTPIPFYNGVEPIFGPYKIHIEWADEGEEPS